MISLIIFLPCLGLKDKKAGWHLQTGGDIGEFHRTVKRHPFQEVNKIIISEDIGNGNRVNYVVWRAKVVYVFFYTAPATEAPSVMLVFKRSAFGVRRSKGSA